MANIVFIDDDGNEERFIKLEDRDNRTNVEKTIFEMMEQRGCVIIEEGEDFLIAKRSIHDTIIIFFDKTQDLNVDKMHKFISRCKHLDSEHCIIVYKGTVTPNVKNMIETGIFGKRDNPIHMIVEIFNETEVEYNITKHRLQPKNIERLNRYECEQFKQKFGVKIGIMGTSDPIARFYNFNVGDILLITRADNTISYRIVKKM